MDAEVVDSAVDSVEVESGEGAVKAGADSVVADSAVV